MNRTIGGSTGGTSEVDTDLFGFWDVKLEKGVTAPGQEITHNLPVAVFIIVKQADNDGVVRIFNNKSNSETM